MVNLLATGRVVSHRYKILGVLGRGGMGVVYRAEDLALRRPVALKLISSRDLGGSEGGGVSAELRVLREASLTAQIGHPNIVTVYDYGRAEEDAETYCYLAMELLSGETLGQRLRRLRAGLPRAEAISIVTEVARGLRAAHQKGLVHRDLKPDNIMLTPGEDGSETVRILDFGLATELAPGPRGEHGADRGIVGTPEYMAPEQAEGRDVDGRADLYALGVVLYECIAGAPPFHGDSPLRIARAHLREPVPPMRIPSGAPRPSLPLQDLVKRLLEKRASARIQTAEEVLRRLKELPEARSASPLEITQAISFSTRSRYRAGKKLSESPRAIVYEATHVELGRPVAIKVFRVTQASESARVLRELSARAALTHPSNVRVLDVGSTVAGPYGMPFLVMERVRGSTLRAVLSAERRLAPARAVEIIAAVLDGLAEAHAGGLAHRLLTPDHVLVRETSAPHERVKIIGHRLSERDAEGSDPRGPVLPEPGYVPPEVLRGAPMNQRGDLYSAGALLFECLLGRRPATALLTLNRPEITAGGLGISPELSDIVRRAISIDPGDRFETAESFAAELRGTVDAAARPAPFVEEEAPVVTSQSRLRSTGAPVLWFLAGDAELTAPEVVDVLLEARSRMRVDTIAPEHAEALAARIAREEELPPWVVLFGGAHVLREDPLLSVLSRAPETARLLVTAQPSPEILEAAIAFGGLDGHVTLATQPGALSAAIRRMVLRAGAARRYYDDLRIVAQRSSSRPGRSDVIVRRA